MSASARCPHSDIDYHVHTNLMVDSNVHSVEIKAKCKLCGIRMRLNRGLPMGASSRFPTRLIDDGGDTLGIMFPMVAEGEEPTKEWGFAISGPRLIVGASPD